MFIRRFSARPPLFSLLFLCETFVALHQNYTRVSSLPMSSFIALHHHEQCSSSLFINVHQPSSPIIIIRLLYSKDFPICLGSAPESRTFPTTSRKVCCADLPSCFLLSCYSLRVSLILLLMMTGILKQSSSLVVTVLFRDQISLVLLLRSRAFPTTSRKVCSIAFFGCFFLLTDLSSQIGSPVLMKGLWSEIGNTLLVLLLKSRASPTTSRMVCSVIFL